MYINNQGQITNKSTDFLLSPLQEEFILTLLEDKRIATDTSFRYGKAIFYNKSVPDFYDQSYSTIEDAFSMLSILEWEAQHSPNFDGHDFAILKELWYYLEQPSWYHG